MVPFLGTGLTFLKVTYNYKEVGYFCVRSPGGGTVKLLLTVRG